MCGLELVEKFVVVGGGCWWWWVVNSEFSVLLWSKPFHSSLGFGLGSSRTTMIYIPYFVILQSSGSTKQQPQDTLVTVSQSTCGD